MSVAKRFIYINSGGSSIP